MFFTVIEVQEIDGVKACLPVIYDDYNLALNKLYTVLAAASVSNLPYHSCHILRSDGNIIDGKVFKRE